MNKIILLKFDEYKNHERRILLPRLSRIQHYQGTLNLKYYKQKIKKSLPS